MATSIKPTTHNGLVNSVINVSDFSAASGTALTTTTADARYLKLTGGTVNGAITMSSTLTETGSVVIGDASTDTLTVGATTTHNAPTIFTSTLTTPSLTFSSATNTQTAGQLGFIIAQQTTVNINVNGTNSYCSVAIPNGGVYIICYGGSIACSTSNMVINNFIYGHSTNNATFSQPYAIQTYGNLGQTLTVGSSFSITGTTILNRNNVGTSFLLMQMTATGSGTLTGTLQIQATRIA